MALIDLILFGIGIYLLYRFIKWLQTKQTRHIPSNVKEEVIKREHGTCAVCPESDRQLFDFHHKVPYSEGGDNSEKNIQVLCVKHHALVTRNNENIHNS